MTLDVSPQTTVSHLQVAHVNYAKENHPRNASDFGALNFGAFLGLLIELSSLLIEVFKTVSFS